MAENETSSAPSTSPPQSKVDNYFLLMEMNKSIGRIEQAVLGLSSDIKRIDTKLGDIEGKISKLEHAKTWILGAAAAITLVFAVITWIKPIIENYSFEIHPKQTQPETPLPPAQTKTK